MALVFYLESQKIVHFLWYHCRLEYGNPIGKYEPDMLLDSQNLDVEKLTLSELPALTEADWLTVTERSYGSVKEAWPIVCVGAGEFDSFCDEAGQLFQVFIGSPGSKEIASRCFSAIQQRLDFFENPVEGEVDWELSGELTADALCLQFLQNVEWPIRLGLLLGALGFNSAKETLIDHALDGFQATVHHWFDGDGLPDATITERNSDIVMGVARAHSLLSCIGATMDSAVVSQAEWVVRQSLRGMRGLNGLLLGSTHPKFTKDHFELLLGMSSDPVDSTIASGWCRSLVSNPDLEIDAEPSACSEWGRTAFLQTDWERKATKLAVDFSVGCRVELFRRQTLLFGDTLPRIMVDGEFVEAVSEPEVVCWHSDEDADLLELEIEFEDGVVLQRQIVLGREDEFVFFGDAVCHHEPGRQLGIELTLPLAEGMQASGEAETNEVYLTDKKTLALILPISIGEWQADKTRGEIRIEESQVVVCQNQVGQNLYGGVFIDLKPKRSVKPRTWRQLTVAENLEKCKPDEAVAFRVQVGKSQWVIYRSLSAPANRTFFGENHLDEFFVGRFTRDGMVPLVKIQ